jgi:hypothetical protein
VNLLSKLEQSVAGLKKQEELITALKKEIAELKADKDKREREREREELRLAIVF